MNVNNTSYRQEIYSNRINNVKTNIDTIDKGKLKTELTKLILDKTSKHNVQDLTDNDYRDILENLHQDSNLHPILEDLGLKSVSKYSWFSNSRATGKIVALQNFLNPENNIENEPNSTIQNYKVQNTNNVLDPQQCNLFQNHSVVCQNTDTYIESLSEDIEIKSIAKYLTPLEEESFIGNAYTKSTLEIFTGLLQKSKDQKILYPFMRTADGNSVYLTNKSGQLQIEISGGDSILKSDRTIVINTNNTITITGYFAQNKDCPSYESRYMDNSWASFGADIIELLTMGQLAKSSGCKDLNLSVADFLKLMSNISIQAKGVFLKEEKAEFINPYLYKTDVFLHCYSRTKFNSNW